MRTFISSKGKKKKKQGKPQIIYQGQSTPTTTKNKRCFFEVVFEGGAKRALLKYLVHMHFFPIKEEKTILDTRVFLKKKIEFEWTANDTHATHENNCQQMKFWSLFWRHATAYVVKM